MPKLVNPSGYSFPPTAEQRIQTGKPERAIAKDEPKPRKVSRKKR